MPTKKKAAPKKAVEKKVAGKKVVAKKTAPQKVVPKKSSVKTMEKSITKKVTPKKTKSRKKISGIEASLNHGIPPYKEKKGEEYMNEDQVNHFHEILLHWKTELMEEVDRTVHHMQDDAANFPDPNDRATQESEFSMELRTRDRERKLIKKIDESIELLNHEDYGYCESCGIEIGVRRLEVRPTATLCIDCKTLDEIREKQSSM